MTCTCNETRCAYDFCSKKFLCVACGGIREMSDAEYSDRMNFEVQYAGEEQRGSVAARQFMARVKRFEDEMRKKYHTETI